ncbi:MAG: FtsH protease activity modulator HflK [Nitrospirae bacterium]|nr:FtsH protease activity modulator HflK [Magnetococcales bacterium]HAT49736.1 FtsH protease activity modulator HflK [Alphaproteobacteria bacterium]
MSVQSTEEPIGQPPANAITARAWAWIGSGVHLLGLRGKGLVLILTLLAIAWVSTGIYEVQPDEQGVILRFGKWVETSEPGLHFHLPYPVESVLLPKITQVNPLRLTNKIDAPGGFFSSRNHQMLTGDENILEGECTVFWRIKDSGKFLFKVENPDVAIRILAESALREVISRTPIQAAMSDKRQQISDQTRDLLQTLLDKADSGVVVTQVQLQRVDPPTAVIDAFNDVQRARADQERARNEAEAYANDIIPRARGEAARIEQDAEAYRSQVVNLAEGEAKGFQSVRASYDSAREVTAWRLYAEGVDELLKKATRVIIDTSDKGVSGIVPYLPLTENDKGGSKPAPPGGDR